MRTRGFYVIRGAFAPPSASVVSSFAERVAAASDPIFNGGEGMMKDVATGDGKRKQVFVRDVAWAPEEAALVATVREAIEQHVSQRQPNDMVALLSEAGCLDQVQHADAEVYSVRAAVKRMGDDGVFGGYPAGCIAALENNTQLNAWEGSIDFDQSKTYPHSRIELNAGDLLVFRIDFIHSGAAYSTANVRIHCFLDREAIARPQNATSMMNIHKNVLPIVD